LAQVEVELGMARNECEDFNYRAKVFGPDEIQATGPQVWTLGNSLLEGCFANKFEIRCHTPLVWEFTDSILSVSGGHVCVGDRQVATG
jgi:hypothetical protein